MIVDRRNRAAVKRRLVLLAQSIGPVVLVDEDDAVTVPAVYGKPPDTATESCIYFGEMVPIEGDSTPTALNTSKPTTDAYLIKGTLDAYGLGSPEDADEAAERILNAFDALVSRCSHLIDPTGTVPDSFEAGEQCPYAVQSARVSAASLVSGKSEGNTYGGRYEFTVACESSIRHPRP